MERNLRSTEEQKGGIFPCFTPTLIRGNQRRERIGNTRTHVGHNIKTRDRWYLVTIATIWLLFGYYLVAMVTHAKEVAGGSIKW